MWANYDKQDTSHPFYIPIRLQITNSYLKK